MYCGSTSLVKTLPDSKTIYCLKCRSWGCETCAPERASQVRAQARNGNPQRFLTLTIKWSEGDDPAKAAQRLKHAFKILKERIVRRYKTPKVEFMAFWERTKAGAPHLHVFLRGRYIRQKWLSDQMDDLIQSPVVYIEKIENKAKAANYVTKYVTKALVKFDRCKRYWCSQGWNLKPRKKAEGDGPVAEWTQSGGTVAQTIQMLLDTYGGHAWPRRFYWVWTPPGVEKPPDWALAQSERVST